MKKFVLIPEDRYQRMLAQQGGGISTDQPHHPSTRVKEVETPPDVEDSLLQGLPKRYRERSMVVLNLLAGTGHVTWAPNGEMIYKGKRVPGSHAVDLLRYLLPGYQKKERPLGFTEFLSTLKATNIPRGLINNREVLKVLTDPVKPPGILDNAEAEWIHLTP